MKGLVFVTGTMACTSVPQSTVSTETGSKYKVGFIWLKFKLGMKSALQCLNHRLSSHSLQSVKKRGCSGGPVHQWNATCNRQWNCCDTSTGPQLPGSVPPYFKASILDKIIHYSTRKQGTFFKIGHNCLNICFPSKDLIVNVSLSPHICSCGDRSRHLHLLLPHAAAMHW